VSFVKHTVEYFVRESWSRYGALARTYADIAQSAYAIFLHEENQLVPRPEDHGSFEYYHAPQDRMHVSAIKTIVFSAMATEAAIFDLGAIHLGDNYVRQYLDRLDLVAKWIVVPKLICGTSLDTNGPGIQKLRALVKARNALVHHKSLPFDDPIVTLKKLEKRSRQLAQDVHVAFECLVLVSLELHAVLRVPACVLPPFEPSVESCDRIPDVLIKVIDKCRETHARHKP
jgi:hypothetical protein